MHSVIESGLEDYLAGGGSGEFHAHLASCANCRETVEEFRKLSGMLSSLRVEPPASAPLGFSSRVVQNVREQRSRSLWSLLVMDSGFTRKLALASLLALGMLGSYLATGNDALNQPSHTPEAAMASHDIYSPDADQHRDGMLVTLATYRQ